MFRVQDDSKITELAASKQAKSMVSLSFGMKWEGLSNGIRGKLQLRELPPLIAAQLHFVLTLKLLVCTRL